jgi:hypothetical protein
MSDLQKFKEKIKQLSSIGNPSAGVVNTIKSLKDKIKEEKSRNPDPKSAPKMMDIEKKRLEKRNEGMKNLKEKRFNKTDVPEKPLLKFKKPFELKKRMEEFRKERKLRPGERKQVRTENMAKGGRAMLKGGGICKKGMNRKAIGKNS